MTLITTERYNRTKYIFSERFLSYLLFISVAARLNNLTLFDRYVFNIVLLEK